MALLLGSTHTWATACSFCVIICPISCLHFLFCCPLFSNLCAYLSVLFPAAFFLPSLPLFLWPFDTNSAWQDSCLCCTHAVFAVSALVETGAAGRIRNIWNAEPVCLSQCGLPKTKFLFCFLRALEYMWLIVMFRFLNVLRFLYFEAPEAQDHYSCSPKLILKQV